MENTVKILLDSVSNLFINIGLVVLGSYIFPLILSQIVTPNIIFLSSLVVGLCWILGFILVILSYMKGEKSYESR